MKKSVFTLILMASLLLTACEPTVYDKFKSAKDVSGIWCLPLEDNTVTWYWELTDTQLTYFENEGTTPAKLENKYIVNGADTKWEVGKFFMVTLSGAYEFDVESQAFYFMGVQMGTVQRVGKDEAILKSDFLKSGTIYRVKGIK
ncbi:MAG: hypothetical protein J5884_07005 [Paludibacteraceae bacterium]|nr:hypothetical protein [Paludibacteraceae bacterium]